MQLLHHLLSTLMFRTRHIELPVLLAMLAIAPLSLAAQQKPTAAGEYAGTLGALHLKLHLNADAAGVLSGTLDSTDQGALGIPCADFHLDGQSLTFTIPAVHGTWKGIVTADGLTGTWDQGAPQPLNFVRDTFVPAAKPSPVDGIWLGALKAGGQSLRIQIHVKSDAAGKEFCTLDSVDQGAMGIECAAVVFAAPNFSFEVPVVHGSWAGTLAADGNALSGTWNQGAPMTLNFTRQQTALRSEEHTSEL